MDSAPRDGSWFLVLVDADGDGFFEPVAVCFNGETEGGADFGPYCWQTAIDGPQIAEKTPVLWAPIAFPEGHDLAADARRPNGQQAFAD
jgi:hypothetical protein